MKITESEGEMTIEKINWFEKAAQAWCHESTKHVDMIPELAMVFALMLKKQHDRLTAELHKLIGGEWIKEEE